MSTEEINRDIERSRERLSRDVDELTYKVSPGQVMERRKQAARSRFASMKDKVMGSVPGTGGSGGSSGGSVGDSMSSVGSSVGDTASGAVQGVQARTEGNPLAAGVIAFGVGMLASSLFPASEKEQRIAQQGMDAAKEHGQPVMDEAKSVASDMGAQLKDTAKEGAEQVKGSAQDSAANLKDQGRDSAEQVKGQQSS